MAVRNFWITLNVDGRATPVETGPRAADGGFTLVVLMREHGGVSEKRLRVSGRVVPGIDGASLVLDAETEPDAGWIALRTTR